MAPGTLAVSVPAVGIIAVQSSRYRLEFDGNDGGGAPNVWYDLVNDPGKTQNLAAKGTTTLGYHNAANYPLVDNWFDATVNGVDTWFHTAGPATVLEVSEQTPEHVVLHSISAFYAEKTPSQKAPQPIDVERYWTLYPDGSVFVRQIIRNQADLNHLGFIAWAINANNLNHGFWAAGTEAGQGDSRWPSGSDNNDSVTGNWWAQFGAGGTAVSRGAVLIDVRDINNPGPANTTRAIVATGSDRASSHIAVRINDGGTVVAGNYAESAWLRLDQTLTAVSGDRREVSTFGNGLDADYRTAPVSVAAGSLATTDTFAGGSEALINGVNLATGRVVLAAAGNHINVTPQVGAGSPVRYGPRLKVSSWTGGRPLITWGGATLQAGTDYNAQVDASASTLYVQLLFDVVSANAGQGQWLTAPLDITPAPLARLAGAS